eukprot:CAMPEP_0117041788 /NCGR_PEP_ID=MMETSP0472-20121206/29151_1 /TAXON_ID=693140 ORGANISM="Tiarina fusus, Strain LIS" /NCGR_SAMPLE_ID=MMETSP0472 /ASSEMBLY_ACC=CAM_ASM_000603 /LENGTH=604 /DNA_ID=CAMNT_0004752873 /DNA_START=199 /DNA_END=2013 /DNA_ORIENTATION=-
MKTAALWLAFVAILHQGHVTQATSSSLNAHQPTGPNALRRQELVRVVLDRQDERGEDDYNNINNKNRPKRGRSEGPRHLQSSGKSSKSCKSSKSSKSGANDNNNNCDEEADEGIEIINTRSCEGLRDLVFELTERIGDVGAETLRFRALADELEQTTMVASSPGSGGGTTGRRERQRQLQTSTDTDNTNTNTTEPEMDEVGQLEDSVTHLDRVRELLATENGRVQELSGSLHQAALDWILRNTDLSNANAALWNDVNALTAENLALQSERDDLSVQIDDLSSHIDDLTGLIDDHAGLNGELNATTAELMAQILRLEAANADYAHQNAALSDHINELEGEIDGLEDQNDILAGLNQGLNATAQHLEGQVDRLEGQVDELAVQNSHLEGLVNDLHNETDRLEEINDQLEANVENLEAEVDMFANKTAELEGINQGLETIAAFLNETAGDFDGTYDALKLFLAQQIQAYHTIAKQTLNNVYIQRVSMWDCAYRDHFGDEPFAQDEDMEIPEEKLNLVMEYLDDRVLGELCLAKNDFAHYIWNIFPDPEFTSNHFVSGINSYTTLALNYYFPDSGEEGGLTDEDWANAGFACERLPNDKKFLHSKAGL